MVRKYKFNLFLKQIQATKDFANIILIPVGLALIISLLFFNFMPQNCDASLQRESLHNFCAHRLA